MSKQLESVRQIYADFGKGNIPGILAALTEDVAWEEGAVDHGIPWLEPGRGTGHVGKFFSVVGRELAIAVFEAKQFFEAGDTVIALCHMRATVRSTGKPLEDTSELHVWRFGSDGKVAGFRHVVDSHQQWLVSR
jgi:ketosteroid isomerase-like protein